MDRYWIAAREVQEGLITLLVNSALPEGRARPYAVITAAPSLWLPRCSSDKATIIDVSKLAPSSEWHTFEDDTDRIMDLLHAAGWQDDYIRNNPAMLGGTSVWDIYTFFQPATLETAMKIATMLKGYSHFALLSSEKRPIAIVLWIDSNRLSRARPKLLELAAELSAVGVTNLFESDGRQSFLLDQNGRYELRDFPSPKDLGILISAHETASSVLEPSGISVV